MRAEARETDNVKGEGKRHCERVRLNERDRETETEGERDSVRERKSEKK